MTVNTSNGHEPSKRHIWKVALASGVLLGAGFGGVALAQANQGAPTTPTVIELGADRGDSALIRTIAATPTVTVAAPPAAAHVASVASPTSVASAASVASPTSVASAKSVASPASVASAASVASPASVASAASVDS